MNKIVFDIETRNTFDDVGSRRPEDLDISVVALYNYKEDKYFAFEEKEFDNMWEHFDNADAIIGFNSNHFDIPLLNKYYQYDLSKKKSIDIMEAVKNSLGRRLKLDWIAKGTLGISKSGHGLEAVEWWNSGEIQKIKDYCIDDVRITREIFEYICEKSSLKYEDFGTINEIKIDTSEWLEREETPESANTELPFLR